VVFLVLLEAILERVFLVILLRLVHLTGSGGCLRCRRLVGSHARPSGGHCCPCRLPPFFRHVFLLLARRYFQISRSLTATQVIGTPPDGSFGISFSKGGIISEEEETFFHFHQPEMPLVRGGATPQGKMLEEK
jgi:hypothetical protein